MCFLSSTLRIWISTEYDIIWLFHKYSVALSPYTINTNFGVPKVKCLGGNLWEQLCCPVFK